MREKIRLFHRGSSLWSPVFTAAGIREILLEFYPNGTASTQQEGWCAFYVRCPEGVSADTSEVLRRRRTSARRSRARRRNKD